MNIYVKICIGILLLFTVLFFPLYFSLKEKEKGNGKLEQEYNKLQGTIKEYLSTPIFLNNFKQTVNEIKKKHNIMLVSNNDCSEYAEKNYMDFFKIKDNTHIFETLLIMIEFNKYDYVIYADGKYLKGAQKDIKQFIYKSGDTDLILFKENNNQINPGCLIYKVSEFSKLHIFNIIQNNKNITYDIYTNQLYTDYKPKNKSYYDIPTIMTGIVIYDFNLIKNFNKSNYSYPFSKISHPQLTEIEITGLPPIETTEKISKKIPKYIFQCMETNMTTISQYNHVINRVRNYNPGYQYFFVNGYEALDFIKSNFDKTVFKCYNNLLPGAFKCDLLRYCLLYVYGGIYIDFNVYMLDKFNNIIEDGDEFISAEDFTNNSVWQGFLMAYPKHPIIKKCIDKCCENILAKKYDYNKPSNTGKSGNRNVMSITGPELVGDCINLTLKTDKKLQIGQNIVGNYKIKLYNFFNNVPYISDSNGKKLATSKYYYDNVLTILYPSIKKDKEIFYDILSGKENYGDAYRNRRVFKF